MQFIEACACVSFKSNLEKILKNVNVSQRQGAEQLKQVPGAWVLLSAVSFLYLVAEPGMVIWYGHIKVYSEAS